MNILFYLDNGYAHLLAAAIVSILKNSKKDSCFNFFILHKDLSEDNCHKIRSLMRKHCKIYFIMLDEDKYLSDFRVPENWTNKVCYYRLVAPHVLKEYSQQHCLDIDKVLFLDADIIVKGDISPIFDIELSNFLIGAVRTPIHVEEKHHFSKIKVDILHKFIYAGLILCNINKWIKNGVFSQAQRINMMNPQGFKWLDMDILNIIFSPNQYAVIDPKYSIHPGMDYPGYDLNHYLRIYEGIYPEEKVKEAFYHPIILQLAEGAKPWRKITYLKTVWLWFKYSLFTPYYIKGLKYLWNRINRKEEI